MTLTCLGSGSSGNCFLLESGGEILLLDAGVKFKNLLSSKRLTSFSRVVGALITHSHKDHSLSVPELVKAGTEIYSTDNLQPLKKYRVGVWDIVPFECIHDIKNYGYIVRNNAEKKTLVYATDTAALPPIKNADYWLVECNYTEKLWNENAGKAKDNYSYFGRVNECHMGLDYLQGYFKALKCPLKALILTHLSENGNADQTAIKAALSPFSALTDIAFAGKEWTL